MQSCLGQTVQDAWVLHAESGHDSYLLQVASAGSCATRFNKWNNLLAEQLLLFEFGCWNVRNRMQKEPQVARDWAVGG